VGKKKKKIPILGLTSYYGYLGAEGEKKKKKD
jgi:hypothetical protein